MIVIELTSQTYKSQYLAGLGARSSARRAGVASVRRPLRGMELKEDTYGNLRVIKQDGTPIPVADSFSFHGYSKAYPNLLIQSIQETRMEKMQIIETFGSPLVFFFGEQPRFLDVSALLLNSQDFEWRTEWWHNYNEYWRGTKLVEQCARLYLHYDSVVVEGYMCQSAAVMTSNDPFLIQLQFRLFVTNYVMLGAISNPKFPIRENVVLPPGVDLTDPAGNDVLYALARDPRAPAQLQREAQLVARRPDQYGAYGTLADLIRQGIVSANYPGQNADAFLQEVTSLVSEGKVEIPPGASRWLPMRTRYVDNIDEWTGRPPDDEPLPTDERNIADLPQTVRRRARGDGIDLGPPAMKELGLIPDDDYVPEDVPPFGNSAEFARNTVPNPTQSLQ